jgi:hypothetical protein
MFDGKDQDKDWTTLLLLIFLSFVVYFMGHIAFFLFGG